jgi:hypothetical protein
MFYSAGSWTDFGCFCKIESVHSMNSQMVSILALVQKFAIGQNILDNYAGKQLS